MAGQPETIADLRLPDRSETPDARTHRSPKSFSAGTLWLKTSMTVMVLAFLIYSLVVTQEL
ncbi:hypothetical protein [Streptomyces sp. C10]|uniref:hypothetical protein n=1 Tax=Streptomyces sp. C10 TaxID=531941 RepID=UPI00397FDC62